MNPNKNTAFSALLIVLLSFTSCTVVRIDQENSESDDQYATWMKTGTGFQAGEFVGSVWESRIIPTFEEEAIEFTTVIEALRNDRGSAIESYGLVRQTGEPYTIFKVKGEATVIEYDDSSRNGVIRIDSNPPDGSIDAVLQVGPVLRGTAIRDSVEFIRFTDVGNQLQFADLAKELNTRMYDDSVAPLDLVDLPGKTITFLGAFRLEMDEPLEDVVITPVRFGVVE